MNYNISIIGAGKIASEYDSPEQSHILTHAHAIVERYTFNLKGFYDIDYRKAVEASKKWGGCAFERINDAYSEADIVCVAVPEKWHKEIIESAVNIDSVKAIISEKPFTTRTEDAECITELLGKYKKTLLLNYSRHYMPEFCEMKKWINDCAGELIMGECIYGKGTLHNASHFIDILHYLMGSFFVKSVGDYIIDYNGDDPSFEFVLEKANDGGKIFFHPIDCSKATVFEMDLIFENGRVRYSDERGIIEYYEVSDDNQLFQERNYCLEESVMVNPSGAMRGLYDNLERILRDNDKPLCSLEEGLYVLRIVDEIRGSVGAVRN